jgi:hypothetical protein
MTASRLGAEYELSLERRKRTITHARRLCLYLQELDRC